MTSKRSKSDPQKSSNKKLKSQGGFGAGGAGGGGGGAEAGGDINSIIPINHINSIPPQILGNISQFLLPKQFGRLSIANKTIKKDLQQPLQTSRRNLLAENALDRETVLNEMDFARFRNTPNERRLRQGVKETYVFPKHVVSSASEARVRLSYPGTRHNALRIPRKYPQTRCIVYDADQGRYVWLDLLTHAVDQR